MPLLSAISRRLHALPPRTEPYPGARPAAALRAQARPCPAKKQFPAAPSAAPPCRTISRRSPCGNTILARTPHAPAQYHVLPPPPSPSPRAEQCPGARPAAVLRALTLHSPAHSNILPPPPPLFPAQNNLPALALRQVFEPEFALLPLRPISCRPSLKSEHIFSFCNSYWSNYSRFHYS